MSSPPAVIIPGGALRRRPAAPDACRPLILRPSTTLRLRSGSGPLRIKDTFIEGPPRPAACRGRLRIGYRITRAHLQGHVDMACRTDATQALTTLLWAVRLDACSRRLLTDALRSAAHPAPRRHAVHPDPGARLPVFAALARRLFRHAVHTLPAHPGNRRRRPRAACPARGGPPDAARPTADRDAPPLLAAIHALHTAARFQPRVSLTDSAAIERLTRAALPALHGLFAALGAYLEGAFQPLEAQIGRGAIGACILETRGELEALAACRPAGGGYLERLTITAAGDTSASIEVEGWLDCAASEQSIEQLPIIAD